MVLSGWNSLQKKIMLIFFFHNLSLKAAVFYKTDKML